MEFCENEPEINMEACFFSIAIASFYITTPTFLQNCET